MQLEHPVLSEEISQLLAAGNEFKLERITSYGHPSPSGYWYDQEQDEWVALLQGKASLEFETGSITLTAGNHLLIPAHCKHRVARVSVDAIWLALHFKKTDHHS